jgi:hypothetical protein
VQEQAVIYAIQAGVGGPIKFGIAQSPKQRLNDLQTANAAQLSLLVQAEWHNDKELLIHRHLRDCRVRGEWFWPTAKAMAVVDVLQDPEGDLCGHIESADPDAMAWWCARIGDPELDALNERGLEALRREHPKA